MLQAIGPDIIVAGVPSAGRAGLGKSPLSAEGHARNTYQQRNNKPLHDLIPRGQTQTAYRLSRGSSFILAASKDS